jgi:selenocysteine lyase/cysteine desulfurase
VTVEEILDNLRRAITAKTRVIGLTWVHSGTGVKLPIRELAAIVSDVNRHRTEQDTIQLIVDGVHGFGNQDETPIEMGCDFFVSGTHKWIFGPRGTGIIWGRSDRWPNIRPTIPTFFRNVPTKGSNNSGQQWPAHAHLVSPGGFKAYEHQWAMPEAFSFHQSIGRKRIADRTAELSQQCKEGLSQIPGVTLHTPLAPELSAGINCFEIKGMNSTAAVQKLLDQNVIASASPYNVSYVRLAPSLVNDAEQVDSALRAVHKLI